MTPLSFVFLLFYTYLATVRGQQSIVSTNKITSGGTFSVYCDAGRATTPPSASSVHTLNISRMVETERNYSLIAQYNSSGPTDSQEIKNIPNGRRWNITFVGGIGGSNNSATMKIVLDVTDAMCSDTGMYRCQIDYYTPDGTAYATAPDQNVTVSKGLSVVDLTVQPDNQVYYKDDNVTFTCKVTGPATGVSFRWEFWVEDNTGIQWPTNLPSNNVIVSNPAAPQTDNTGCPQFEWVSMLSIQVPADYEQQMYKCIVGHMQMEQSSNLTIGIAGASGQSIVSTNTVTSGWTFSVYCDASRATTPSGAYSVQSLFIYRMVGTERNYSLIAQYNSISPSGLSGEIKNIPYGRLWNVKFSGANGGVNNVATMKIVLDVYDVTLSDAGMYRCQIGYYTTTGSTFVTAPDQNVTVSMSGQQSIVSTNTITSGGTFSVHCDASRATTPPGASSVESLFIYRMVGTERNYSLIAQYNSINPPGLSGEIKNIPNGRLWNIKFSGANGGSDNIATMKIVLDVYDAMFSDAGMYRCQIDYYTAFGSVTVTALDQNVTASMSGKQSTVSTLSTRMSTSTATSGGTFSVYTTLHSTPAFIWLFLISWQVYVQ